MVFKSHHFETLHRTCRRSPVAACASYFILCAGLQVVLLYASVSADMVAKGRTDELQKIFERALPPSSHFISHTHISFLVAHHLSERSRFT